MFIKSVTITLLTRFPGYLTYVTNVSYVIIISAFNDLAIRDGFYRVQI